MDKDGLIWFSVPTSIFIILLTWNWYRARKESEKESERRRKEWEDLDLLEGLRPSKIERAILYEVRDHLTEIWYEYGNPGKNYNDADHKFLQAILERSEDLRRTLKPSQEILQTVDTILERARKTVMAKQILTHAIQDKEFSVKWDLRSITRDERLILLLGARRLLLWIFQVEMRSVLAHWKLLLALLAFISIIIIILSLLSAR